MHETSETGTKGDSVVISYDNSGARTLFMTICSFDGNQRHAGNFGSWQQERSADGKSFPLRWEHRGAVPWGGWIEQEGCQEMY